MTMGMKSLICNPGNQLKLTQAMYVAPLFPEMPAKDALRLAQLHNRVDAMHHNLTTADKVFMIS